eukprot:7381535-Prymnesium_polylepis.1
MERGLLRSASTVALRSSPFSFTGSPVRARTKESMSGTVLIEPASVSCLSAMAFSLSTRSLSLRLLKAFSCSAAAASAAEVLAAAFASRNSLHETRRPLGNARRRAREPSSSMTTSISSSSAQPSPSALERPSTARAASRPAAMPATPSSAPARKAASAVAEAEGAAVVGGRLVIDELGEDVRARERLVDEKAVAVLAPAHMLSRPRAVNWCEGENRRELDDLSDARFGELAAHPIHVANKVARDALVVLDGAAGLVQLLRAVRRVAGRRDEERLVLELHFSAHLDALVGDV